MGSGFMKPGDDEIHAAIAQQAGEWFIAHQAGPLAEEESAAFLAWLKASPIHVREYLGVARVAHQLQVFHLQASPRCGACASEKGSLRAPPRARPYGD